MAYAFHPILFYIIFAPVRSHSLPVIGTEVGRVHPKSTEIVRKDRFLPSILFSYRPATFLMESQARGYLVPSVARLFLWANHRGSTELLHRSSAGGRRGGLLLSGACPPRVPWEGQSASIAGINRPRTSDLCKVWPSWRSNMLHRHRRPTPAFFLVSLCLSFSRTNERAIGWITL